MATQKEKSIRDYRSHRYTFRLNDAENAQFLEMLSESGAPTITRFVVHRLFG